MGVLEKYDVEYGDGHHELAASRAEVYDALSHGAAYAVELERANWHDAIAAEHRAEVAVLDAVFEARQAVDLEVFRAEVGATGGA